MGSLPHLVRTIALQTQLRDAEFEREYSEMRVKVNPLQQTLQFISISYATVLSVGEKGPEKENRRC